jgi:hypothetical protein
VMGQTAQYMPGTERVTVFMAANAVSDHVAAIANMKLEERMIFCSFFMVLLL